MASDQEIRLITQSVWTSVLGLTASPAASAAGADASARRLVGSIHISGAWQGALTLECGEPLARKATSIMFGAEPASLSDGEMSDALGELTNMVGGNFKALLAGACQLSLPTVVAGTGLSVALPGNRLVHRVAFECDGQPFSISVLQRGEVAS